jgi:hypothetical protein
MNTPSHWVLSAAVLGRGPWRNAWRPILAGAIAPDLPMLLFYVYQRLVVAAPDRLIWSQLYFAPGWQAFFDAFNSFPLIALMALAAWVAGSRAGLAMSASMALHCLLDLPLHREDAHGHFFPLSSWRFTSPVSYWDVRHYGAYAMAAEVTLTVVGCVVLLRRTERPWRIVGGATLLLLAASALGALAYFF